jgi:hypothetical protein
LRILNLSIAGTVLIATLAGMARPAWAQRLDTPPYEGDGLGDFSLLPGRCAPSERASEELAGYSMIFNFVDVNITGSLVQVWANGAPPNRAAIVTLSGDKMCVLAIGTDGSAAFPHVPAEKYWHRSLPGP